MSSWRLLLAPREELLGTHWRLLATHWRLLDTNWRLLGRCLLLLALQGSSHCCRERPLSLSWA